MRLGYLFIARLKESLRQPFSLFFIVLAVLVAVSAAALERAQADGALTVAVVNEDAGPLGDELIAILMQNGSFECRRMTSARADRLLRQDRLAAIAVIHGDFTEQITSGGFKDTLTVQISPSTAIAPALTEPLINGVIMLWVEEEAIRQTGDYLLDNGLSYDLSDEAAQREAIQRRWDDGSIIRLEHVTIDGAYAQPQPDTPFNTFVRWYAVLCFFYLVAGAYWALELNKRAVRTRARQSNTPLWRVVGATSLAPMAIAAAGYLVGGTAVSVLMGTPIVETAQLFTPVLLYLVSIVGVTLVLASALNTVMALLFLAPAATFINGVLSGLLLQLPDWAYVLRRLSAVLPGRWLNTALGDLPGSLMPAFVCAAVWLTAGVFASVMRARQRRTNGSI